MSKAKRPPSRKTTPKSRTAPPIPARPAPSSPPRIGRPSLKALILDDLLRRPDGASLADMALATGWKEASVRGMISGVFRKRLRLAVTTSLHDGIRIYRIAP